MSKPRLVPALAAALVLAACSATDRADAPGTKQTAGAAVGAVSGAVLGGIAGNALGGKGKNAVAIGAGAALGGIGGLLVGSSVGASLDRADRLHAERSWSTAMTAPVGEPIVWENPETGNRGHTVATRQGRLASNERTCREYTSEIVVGGRRETMVGTACRNPDGTWADIG
jgi:surface antigen